MASMQKMEAIQALGGTIAAAARAIGITPQAVGQWPDELSPAIRDRVQAALWRHERSAEGAPELIGADGALAVPETAAREAA